MGKSGTANAGATKVVNVTDGLLATDNITLTGALNSGTHSESFKVVHLVPADLFKCISSASTVQVQHVTLGVVALALAWQQYMFQKGTCLGSPRLKRLRLFCV